MLVKLTQFGNQQTIQLCSIVFLQNNKFVYKILKGKAEAMCRKRLHFCLFFHATGQLQSFPLLYCLQLHSKTSYRKVDFYLDTCIVPEAIGKALSRVFLKFSAH